MSKKKSASSRSRSAAINPLELPVAKALQGVVGDLQKTTQSVVKEVQKRIPADWNRNVKLIQQRLDRTATQADLQKLAKRVEDLTKQVERLATGRAAATSTTARRTARKTTTRTKRAASTTAAKTRRTARKTAASASSTTPSSGSSSSSSS